MDCQIFSLTQQIEGLQRYPHNFINYLTLRPKIIIVLKFTPKLP